MAALPSPADCQRIYAEERLDPRVVAHAQAVADLARRVAARLEAKGHPVNVALVEAGALLHDIGRSRGHGLRHASDGAALLRARGLPEALCLCVERHTGGGIDLEEARRLGLPPKDYTPRTLEEKLVCHIDNLFDGPRRQTVADELRHLRSQGLEAAARKVQGLHEELSTLLGVDLDRFA